MSGTMVQIADASDWRKLEGLGAEEVIEAVLAGAWERRACITCSFQAEGVALLHMLRKRVARIPVLFLETGYHFAETYEFRNRLAREWELNLVNVMPEKTVREQEAQFGILYREEPSKCCEMRKVEPLMRALEGYEIWFTGLRREQSPTRRNVRKAEEHWLTSRKRLLKVNPLADWTEGQVWRYTRENRLPYLPQYDRGYTSIGCEPCTDLPSDASNPRSGRWEGKKLECGIHVIFDAKGV